jgi:hypothetical protein
MIMAAAWTKSVLAGVVLPATFSLAAHSPVIDQSIDKRLPPRSEQPVMISYDPVEHGLKGWKRFGYMTIKGTEQDALKAAAKRGVEAVAY